ncbi:DUF2796 domain-containing protein [Stutzerimonas azotifigens]|uniref:DUF2796 domain-containing protein n=1 Tax=Stutzerimonas azotifigens TaxID=291995 RepID=UPI0004259879|nr:DUF2796 domain-containing protein [Stutzerimonas azotifigens]
MRAYLLPCLLLLPLTAFAADDHDHHAHDHAHSHEHAHEHEHEHEHEHGALGAHEHGAAELDVALENNELTLALDSPAVNFLGFEHAPGTPEEQGKAADVRMMLERPLEWLGLAEAAGCEVIEQSIQGQAIGLGHPGYGERSAQPAAEQDGHSDLEASYRLKCQAPDALDGLDLRALFAKYSGLERLQVQFVGPDGQAGAELTPSQPRLSF